MVPCPTVLAGGSDETLRPLRFSPVLKSYTWGGRKLETILGRELPPGVTAESWEISAHPNGPTPVAAGPWDGATLDELLDRFGPDLVGSRCATALGGGRFPLLVKVLDAAEWLSVQVHPDDAAAAREGDNGKTEMWVVLQADEGAELIQGFVPGVDRSRFAAAVAAGDADDLLHRSPVRAGDAFFLRPGVVHALGPGVLLVEIQQSSDLTYRVFDWNRGHPDRPLHLERALEVLDFGVVRPGPVEPVALTAPEDGNEPWSVEVVASCPYFETQRMRLAAGGRWRGRCDGTTFEIWGVIAGSARLAAAGGDAETLTAVEWRLLPAALGEFELRADDDATLLRVFVPAP